MAPSLHEHLSTPLATPAGVPRRVAVYSRIAEAIRGDLLLPGSLVPSESDLGAQLGVSRTVVREALMLLEEDGLVRSQRGVGRFVADVIPRIGIERLRPLEEVLGESEPVTVERTEHTLQNSSSPLIADALGQATTDSTWFTESVIRRAGHPIAVLQEHVPAGARLEVAGVEIAAAIAADDRPDRSLLRRLGDAGVSLGPAESTITVSTAGAARALLLGSRPAEPVLVLTVRARLSGNAFYLAKHILTATAGTLSLQHAATI